MILGGTRFETFSPSVPKTGWHFILLFYELLWRIAPESSIRSILQLILHTVVVILFVQNDVRSIYLLSCTLFSLSFLIIFLSALVFLAFTMLFSDVVRYCYPDVTFLFYSNWLSWRIYISPLPLYAGDEKWNTSSTLDGKIKSIA